ncbi:aminoglycoside phosphotransferase family protein [Paucisalibacillus globulus]|uniref:aminoglycoside phosphotransferase family protein n=1 Tax=Paucisalibacillus globulus TaxID=351095 RepID=UPI000424C337|nr:aminoglycoside phosphotransferase family protein [Paucisalibacillus globulus]
MKIGRKIGEGGNSEVFEWEGRNKVIKLAKPNTHKIALEREFKNNLIAWEMGLAVPRPYEIVAYNDRPGIVFDRVVGETLKERLFNNIIEQVSKGQSTLDFNDIRHTARLLSEIHRISHKELRPQREFLKKQIVSVNYLNDSEKDAVIGILDGLPIKSQMCHGDPNPNNIVMSNGNPVFIDWNDASCGNPETDVAEYIIMIKYAVLPADTQQNIVRYFDAIRGSIIRIFVDEYTLLTGITYEEVDPWIVPIAARKLSADGISEEEKQLLVNEIKLRLGK